jgi:hypothetical protein
MTGMAAMARVSALAQCRFLTRKHESILILTSGESQEGPAGVLERA